MQRAAADAGAKAAPVGLTSAATTLCPAPLKSLSDPEGTNTMEEKRVEATTAAAERSEVKCGGEPQEEPKDKEMIAGSRGKWDQVGKKDTDPRSPPLWSSATPYVSAA